MRYKPFIGTAKEIAEQFNKDLGEARFHLMYLTPFSDVVIWISRRLYGIIAAYYGESLCHHSNGVSTIQGIKVEQILDDFNDGCFMFEMFACKESGLYPTRNGAYIYKEKNNGT